MEKNKDLIVLLNHKEYDYVVFDSFNSNGKTFFDIYISPNCYNDAISCLKSNSFEIQSLNDHCLYGMKKILFFENGNVVYRLFSRPAIISLDYSWVPFNKIVEKSFLYNKKKQNDYFVLSSVDDYFYLICKNVFNNKNGGFDERDIERIEVLKQSVSLKTSTLIEMFESVFYKFCPTLFNLIENKNYNQIYQKYISFKDY